jgi:ribosome-associated protein
MRKCLLSEVEFRTSRSSGPGGQHVNKTETRVELLWFPLKSMCLNENQKQILTGRLGKRLTREGALVLVSEKYRSQHRNRAEVTGRFMELVTSSLVPVKKRKPTRPTRSSVEKRIRNKKLHGEIKKLRSDRRDEQY